MRLFIASIKAGECEREAGWKMEDGWETEQLQAVLSERPQFVIRPESSITQITAGSNAGQVNSLTYTHPNRTKHTVKCKWRGRAFTCIEAQKITQTDTYRLTRLRHTNSLYVIHTVLRISHFLVTPQPQACMHTHTHAKKCSHVTAQSNKQEQTNTKQHTTQTPSQPLLPYKQSPTYPLSQFCVVFLKSPCSVADSEHIKKGSNSLKMRSSA